MKLLAVGWVMLWSGLAIGDIGDPLSGGTFSASGALAVICLIGVSVGVGYMAGKERR